MSALHYEMYDINEGARVPLCGQISRVDGKRLPTTTTLEDVTCGSCQRKMEAAEKKAGKP